MKVASHVRRLERERPPELIEGAIERASGGQHADDGMRLVIEQNRSTDNRRIRPKLVDPEHVAEERHMMFSALIFAGQERSTSLSADAVDVEVTSGNSRASELHGFAVAGQCRGAAGLSRHEVEDGVVALPVQEVQRGDTVAIASGRLLEDADDSIGVSIRQRPEQDTVNEAENCRVGPNAE